MSEQGLDTSATALVASKAVGYGGSLSGVVSAWVGSIDLVVWVSVIIAIGGFLMNWYFARKKDKRDEIEHKAFLENLKIKGKCDDKQD
ncbi:holin [Acinetobacter guerrae]|uniref:holin n=1 Tax=Acinetobacter guerrae TaxID=1843371 RepID=UPI00125F0206|nr:holin [Acinetobacter guerrae]